MRFGLLIQGGALATGAAPTALGFAQAAVEAGHEVRRVFFYKDAVAIGNRFAADERGVRAAWAEFGKRHDVELVLCVGSAQRRGVVEETVAEGFQLAGLGLLVEAMIEADRLISF